MNKIIGLLVVLAGAYFAYSNIEPAEVIEVGGSFELSPETMAQLTEISDRHWQSGDQVKGSGSVDRILSDDNDGSRHQRFILKLASGRTVLVAHNIDLAPRVDSLRTGDTVFFHGQYETNDRGGVIHWTHKDPQGRHTDGWLEVDGRRFE